MVFRSESQLSSITGLDEARSGEQHQPPDDRHADQAHEYRCRTHVLGLPRKGVDLRADAVHCAFQPRIEEFGDEHNEKRQNEQRALRAGFSEEKPDRCKQCAQGTFDAKGHRSQPGRLDSLRRIASGVQHMPQYPVHDFSLPRLPERSGKHEYDSALPEFLKVESMWRKFLMVLVGCFVSLSLFAESWTVESLGEALQARSEEDRGRDDARRPAEVLVAVGIEPGMQVIDLMSSGGWYSEVLSIAVGEEGRVYAQNPPLFLQFRDGFYDKALTARLADNRLANVKRMDVEIAAIDLQEESLDAAFTALNLHDVYHMAGETAAVAFLGQVGSLLKPGGKLVVIDHHGAVDGANTDLHRMTEDQARSVIEAAGFEIVAAPQVLRHPEDDLSLMVFAPEIRGKTDRFILVGAKPL